jgi:hypothetical protein
MKNKTKKRVDITPISGNVFEDLGLPDADIVLNSADKLGFTGISPNSRTSYGRRARALLMS